MEETFLGSGSYGEVKTRGDKAVKIFNIGNFTRSLAEIDVLFRVKNCYLLEGHQLFAKNKKIEVTEDLMTGDGVTLMNIIDESPEDKQRIFSSTILISCCEALVALEKAGYYNVDVKPENILYLRSEDTFTFKLCDYGFCIPSDGTFSQTVNKKMGTQAFISPEQKSYYVTFTTPIWQLALSIINIYTGQTHYSLRESAANWAKKQLKNCSDELFSSVLVDMLNEDPYQRPRAKEILARFGKISPPTFLKPVLLLKVDAQVILNHYRQFLSSLLPFEFLEVRVLTLAWHYIYRTLSNDYLAYYQLAENFYNRDPKKFKNLTSLKLVDLINSLDGCLFVNPLFFAAEDSEDIITCLLSLNHEVETYAEKINQEANQNEGKNFLIKVSLLLE